MEEEVAELRRQLQATRNDVKSYASFALRLQQELAREKQKQKEFSTRKTHGSPSYAGPSGIAAWDKKVEKTRKEHDVCSRKIERIVDGRRGDPEESDVKRGNQVEDEVDTVLQRLVPFLQKQKRVVGELGRENAKLRDMLFHSQT